jgi:hypothetical protein
MKFLIVLICSVLAVCAANYFVFNPSSSPVANQGVAFVTSQHAPPTPNVLTNPAMPNLPIQWLKASNGLVVAMTAAESNSVLAAQAATNTLRAGIRQTQAKAHATNTIESLLEDGRLLRALAEVTMDEINILRTNMPSPMAPRNLNQLKNAIRNKIVAQPDTQ